MDKVDMADLFLKSIRVAKKHKVRLPRDFVLLGKAFVTLQSISVELNPQLNLVRATQPFITKLSKQKANPSYLLRRFARETQRFAEFVHELPDESRKVYSTIEKADVALDTINTDIRGLTNEIRVEGWRIIMGIIIAALVVGASLMYNLEKVISQAFIFLACIILLYLLFSIARDNFRNKKW
jgi:ubiquinone biosynthesis protein